MMKKIIFTFVAFISAFVSEAQIQIKKDKVLYDKNEVAKIENPFRDRLVFSNLSGEQKFIVDFKSLTDESKNFYQWLEVTSADKSQKSEIEYEVLITSFNSDRIITHLLSLKYGLITAKGIDEDALTNFFEENTTKISEKYMGVVAVAKEQESERKQQEQQIKNTYNPQVERDKSVTFNQGGKKRIVGKFSLKPFQASTTQDYITVIDLDGRVVATMMSTSSIKDFQVKTWDNNTYTYNAKRSYDQDSYAFLNEFLVDLVSRGYYLEHQIKTQSAKLHQAKVDLAVKRSINVYGAKGYVMDSDGTRYDGKITAVFEMLDVNETGQKLPEFGPDNYGQKVLISYVNDKGKTREKTFKAKDDNYFCVQTNQGEVCYYGLKTKGEAMKKLQNLDSFKFNNAYYYRVIAKEKGIMLLQDPVESEKYVVKIESEDKAQMLDNRSNEKLSDVLGSYLNKCSDLSKEIKSGVMDTKSEQNLIQIIKEYSQCIK